MREQVLDPLGMKHSSYVWQPELESRMAAGYDGQENRLDVQAAIGRRTLVIARIGVSRSMSGDTKIPHERSSWSIRNGPCCRCIWCPMRRPRC